MICYYYRLYHRITPQYPRMWIYPLIFYDIHHQHHGNSRLRHPGEPLHRLLFPMFLSPRLTSPKRTFVCPRRPVQVHLTFVSKDIRRTCRHITDIRRNKYIHTCMHACMYGCMYVCICAQKYIYICVHITLAGWNLTYHWLTSLVTLFLDQPSPCFLHLSPCFASRWVSNPSHPSWCNSNLRTDRPYVRSSCQESLRQSCFFGGIINIVTNHVVFLQILHQIKLLRTKMHLVDDKIMFHTYFPSKHGH